MDDPRDINRVHWDERAAHHPETDYYDVEGFLDGGVSLTPEERQELDPDGDLLHLQCHFGLDTLSWLREGATEVVGVDFSGVAVEQARDLAERAGLADRAEFVEADVLDVRLDRTFDAVFVNFGSIYWLPDLDRWAETVAAHLADDGVFYCIELHPVTHSFVEYRGDTATVGWPYFADEGVEFEADGSYADFDAEFEHTRAVDFPQTVGEVLTALADAGLRIEFVHEFPWCDFQKVPGMTADEEGRWWPDAEHDLPFTMSVQARHG